ncbi:MAG TPA: hypothetical protein VNX68_09455 [Nitrosopumilaceae archaeon]|nr:hypothetical protein [Nitrosopumilaceae archaeon]
MSDIPPPQRVSDEIREDNLTGYVFPWANDRPVLAKMAGNDLSYLLLFATADKLSEFLPKCGIEYQSIKQIDNPVEFIDNLPKDIVVVYDPYMTNRGTVRWVQVLRKLGDII